MQTEAWKDKELQTALASWTELRHDTILYAKQSYTMMLTSVPVQVRVPGYVEPVPEVYNRLLSLTRMMRQGLDAMNVLAEAQKANFARLEDTLGKLVAICLKEHL
jgi:hypothetical protein